MSKVKHISSSPRIPTSKQNHAVKGSKKSTYAEIYPMMPRGYTAVQRAQLRRFERELYAGKKITVE